MDADTPNQLPARISALEWGCLVAVVLGCAAAMSPNQADPDLWGHVVYGIDAMRDGLASTTTYSYTAEGFRWINHENIAELMMAVVAVSFGPTGLLVMKCCFGITIISAIAWWGYRQRVPLPPLAIALVVVAVNMAYWWAVRPQMFSFLYFALLIALVNWAFDGWAGRWHWPLASVGRKPLESAPSAGQQEAYASGSPSETKTTDDLGYNSYRIRWLWLAPFLFFLWANTHGGFVAGLCIYSAFLGLRAIEALIVRGRGGWGLARRMALMIAVAWLATLVNPYGPGLHQWLLGSLGEPRPEISEWSPLRFGAEPFVPFAVLAALVVVGLLFSRKQFDLTYLVLLGITAWQSVEHERHIPFFAILFGYWLPPHLQSVMERFKISEPGTAFTDNLSPALRRCVVGGLCVVFAVLGLRLYGRLADMPVHKDKFPVAAMQYIADQDMDGKLVVTFNWAQYAIAALGPSTPEAHDGLLVQFDGRFRTCYPQEVVDMHFDFVLGDGPEGTRHRSTKSGVIDGNRVLDFAQPDVVLLNRRQINSVEVMEQREDFVLLYQDELAQVWGRASKFNDPINRNYIAEDSRHISDAPQQGSATWPALPERRRPGGLASAGKFVTKNTND